MTDEERSDIAIRELDRQTVRYHMLYMIGGEYCIGRAFGRLDTTGDGAAFGFLNSQDRVHDISASHLRAGSRPGHRGAHDAIARFIADYLHEEPNRLCLFATHDIEGEIENASLSYVYIPAYTDSPGAPRNVMLLVGAGASCREVRFYLREARCNPSLCILSTQPDGMSIASGVYLNSGELDAIVASADCILVGSHDEETMVGWARHPETLMPAITWSKSNSL